MNSSERRKDVDKVLKDELGQLAFGVAGFRKTLLDKFADLDKAS